jgi:hypothetical protein
MKRAVIIAILALAGCAPEGAREIDAVGREYLSAAAAGDTARLRAVSVGTQPLIYAAAIRERRPELLARTKKASREALELRADTALVDFETNSDGGIVGMRMLKRAGEWKIERIQVRHL